MIEFHLDGRSGVAPYMQLIQQVRQALRLGLLREGDRLPTIKDVVAKVAINPNTVLKAYRELEYEGLVTARPGVGTFVARTLNDERRRARAAARRAAGLAAPGAGRRPRRGKHRGAVRHHLPHAATGVHMTDPVLQAEGLTKRYGRRAALSDCTLEIPPGRVVGLVGPNGAGKTTLLQLAVGMLTPTAGRDQGARRPPRRRPGPAGQGGLRRAGRAHLRRPVRRRPPAVRRPHQPELGPGAGRRADRRARPGPDGRRRAGCPAASAPSSR